MKWIVTLWAALIGVAAFGQNTVRQVPNVARLIQSAGSANSPLVETAGYYAAGDGGGALYRWTNSAPAVTNALGGALAVAGGAWVQMGYEINVRQFGARGDGTTDDFASLQAAANWIGDGQAGTLYFPPGTYALDEADDFIVKGPGRYYGSDATIKLLSDSISGQTVKFNDESSRVIWDGINIDANNIPGQNGIGVADGVRDLWIMDLSVSNCVHQPAGNAFGGRGVTIQHANGGGARRVMVTGVSVFNSYAAFDVSGRFSTGEPVEDQGAEGIRISDCYAYNCSQLLESYARNNTTFPQEPKYLAAVISNVQGYNVGYPTAYSTNLVLAMSSYTASTITCPTNHYLTFGDPVQFAAAFGNVVTNTTYYVKSTPSATTFTFSETDAASGAEFNIGASGSLSASINVQWFRGGAIVFDRGGNMVLSNVQIYNDDTYPRLPAVIKGKASGLVIDNMSVHADVQNFIDGRSFSESSVDWAPQAQGFRDSVINAKVFGDVGTIVVAEDGGAAKMTDNQVTVMVDSLRWGIVDPQAGLKGDNYISATDRITLKRRQGLFTTVYSTWNDFSAEQMDTDWRGNVSLMRFDIVRTANTNTAIGTIYNGGLLQLRAQAQTLATLGDGLFSLNSAAWNGNGKLSLSDNRLWFDGGILRTRNGVNPSSVSDGFAIAGRLPVDNRPGDTTFNVLTHSPVQLFDLSANSTVTMSTNSALRGQIASIVRDGSELYTLNVGPGIKTIPAGMPATVDLIYDGTNWVTLRYTEHVSQPLTVEVTESGGDVEIVGGGRRTYSHSLNASTGGDANLVFSSVVDGDTGTLLVRAASTNVTLTLTDAFAYSPSGSTLTVTGGTNNWSVVAWEARTINSTNVVLVNLGDYSR